MSTGRPKNKATWTDLEIYGLCKNWAAFRPLSFPHWDKDDIINEAFIHAKRFYEMYDPEGCSFKKHLDIRLYEPVRRNYAKSIGLRISRETHADGRKNQGTRKFVKMIYNHLFDDETTTRTFSVGFVEPHDLPFIPKQHKDLVQLLLMGNNQRQAAVALGITESAVSHRMVLLRKYFLAQFEKGQSFW